MHIQAVRSHISELDGWRGGAILLLLGGHFGLYFPLGRLGVECFFVLSGRLMAELLFVRKTPLPIFYLHRVARIIPALLVFIAGVYLASMFLPSLNVKLADVFKTLTFTINYFPGAASLSHIWSLCIEEHSYILLSVIAIMARSRNFNVAVVLFAIACAFAINGFIQTWVFERGYYEVYWRTDTRATSIFLAASAHLYLRDRTVSPWFPVATGLLGFALNLHPAVADPIKYSVGSLCLALSVATVTQSYGLVKGLLRTRALMAMGLWSFSIYLWQQPFATFYPGYKSYVLLSCVFLVALASFYLVETPLRRWINGWGQRLKLRRA